MRPVGVGTRVGHGEDTPRVVLQRVVDFVDKRATPDRLPAFAGSRWVPGLDHEALDVAVKEAVVVIVGRAKSQKVLE